MWLVPNISSLIQHMPCCVISDIPKTVDKITEIESLGLFASTMVVTARSVCVCLGDTGSVLRLFTQDATT